MTDHPRLIEVAFPLKQASLASVHEKNVRHGHISTLHIWPARRPLAASRAALLATLLPDPGDADKRKELLDLIGGHVSVKTVKSTDDDGNTFEEEKEVVTGGVLAWGQENAPAMDDLRAMIRAAHGGRAPKMIDPFSGGGAIPLEAMRLGCEVTAADINPVAWFILKCTLEYPQKFAGKSWPLPDFVQSWPDFLEDYRAGKTKKRRGKDKPHFSDPRHGELDGSVINPDAKAPSYKAIEAFSALPDADLSWHVRAWGRWVLERARQELAARYPVVDGEPTVAYLWARTARDKLTAGSLPLLKTFWLCKKAGRRAAILPVPALDGKSCSIALLQEPALQAIAARAKDPGPFDQTSWETILESCPGLGHQPGLAQALAAWEITPANLHDLLNQGTMNRAGVWSPLSGRPGMIALTMADLRRQGQHGLLGSQMTAVVVEKTTVSTKEDKKGNKKETHKTRKAYRLPTQTELNAADVGPEDLEEVFKDIPFGIPDEPLPAAGTLGFRMPLYGFKTWREIFTPRQLMALGCFVKHARAAIENLRNSPDDVREAIACYLACIIDRVADRSSSVCSWTLGYDQIRNTFARFALPMNWDLAEAMPTNATSGGYPGQMELVAGYVESSLTSFAHSLTPSIVKESAIEKMERKLDVVVTDPPYYDAIPYSDLMDFFYVWLKRCIRGVSEGLDQGTSEALCPKWDTEKEDGELVDDESRFAGDRAKSKLAYENGMGKAFAKSLQALDTDGRLVVVFANKQVDAWETLVGALIKGGAVVTASWPIQTEREARTRGQSSAALSSSVWIVCRKRAKTAVAGWEERVLEQMRSSLFDAREALGGRNILQYYFDLGIRGPDFLWAALGPALEAYSAHPYVKKTEGGVLTVTEFLKEVRRLVLHFALGELPGFRDISSQTQGRGESLEIDPVTQYYLLHRAYFGLTPAPAGACIMYATACGKSENELKTLWNILDQGGGTKRGRPKNEEIGSDDEDESGGESKGSEFKLVPWDARAERDDLGEFRAGLPAPLIDRLHRMMKLFQQNRVTDVQQAYDTWGLANERAFPPLLQAVRELAMHDNQDAERRLVEALASQLKLNRRQVVETDGVSRVAEMPLFEETKVDTITTSKTNYRAEGKSRRKKP
jgi:putative DNA methylase